MWINSYLQETLLRDRIAETDRVAATRQLLRSAEPPPPPAAPAARPAGRPRPFLEGPIMSALLRLGRRALRWSPA